jgi:formylglycine-generating enzyme required for sulfatase activity
MKIVLYLLTIAVLTCSFVPRKKNFPYIPKEYRADLMLIPDGEVKVNGAIVKTNEFFMFQTEVSNMQFNRFLMDLKIGGHNDEYLRYKPDSTLWDQEIGYQQPSANWYHSHPAFSYYPVVNITHEAAQAYCNWLTDQMNVELEEESYSFLVTLPSKAEWKRAAEGTNKNSNYAWGGMAIRNELGCPLCNFMEIGESNITYDPVSQQYVLVDGGAYAIPSGLNGGNFLLAPVDAYAPSTVGLYNMNGNAAEMIDETSIALGGSWKSPGYDVRNNSEMQYSGPSTQIGFRPKVVIITRPE